MKHSQFTTKVAAILIAIAVSAPSIFTNACDKPDYEVIRARKRMLNQKRQVQAAPVVSVSASTSGATGGATQTPVLPGGSSVASSTTPTGPAFTPPTDPFAVIPLTAITSGAPSEALPPLATTYQAGVTPPLGNSGAPPLPSLTLTASTYPPENTVPPTNSPQVSAWMQEIAGIDPNILAITPTVDGSCVNDPQAASDTSRCWWTCGGCTNNTAPYNDITTCPDKMTWGLSFDDGPAPYSPKVLNFLSTNNLNGTFFIVGSRALERPAMLQAEYMLGHQIAVHTWSHSIPLTALSNEQVVAELGWSRKIIQEIIGVTPVYMRPPYGDIDNRVRAISLAMGMQPIIWTRNPATGEQFDTNDWHVPAGTVTGPESFQQFQYILGNATQLSTGFIVLEHDLFQEEVDLSTGYFIPAAQQARFNLMDINQCQHNDASGMYLETIQDKSKVPTYPGAGEVDVQGNGQGVAGTGNGTSVSNGKGGSSGSTAEGSGGAAGLSTSLGLVLSTAFGFGALLVVL